MKDYSYLDKKYFIDRETYNCPFCNRNSVPYDVERSFSFNWTDEKICKLFLVKCFFCKNTSMHLSFEDIIIWDGSTQKIRDDEDIDSKIFYSVPTSFFVLDNRVPEIIRELITESEGCLKMNFLTGASACMRKAIYELLIKEKGEGTN